MVNGALGAYLSRGARQLQVFVPDDEPARSTVARAVAERLAEIARAGGLLIAEVNGVPSPEHPIAPYLIGAGFVPSAMGFMMRRAPAAVPGFTLDPGSEDEPEPAEDEDALAPGSTKRHA
jgi:ATP-dependent Lhr-like helicase